MDVFYFCLTLGPLAVYMVALGLVNLSRRPVVVSGARDSTALGLAVGGMVIGGPMALFFPEHAAARFGPLVWVLLIAFYTMGLTLWVLISRPRLVVYNISPDRLRPVLSELATQLDSQAVWAGDSLELPGLDVHLHLEDFPNMRNVSLISTGERQGQRGWQRLERALAGRLRQLDVGRNQRGLSLISFGLALLVWIFYWAIENPQAVAQGLQNLLRL